MITVSERNWLQLREDWLHRPHHMSIDADSVTMKELQSLLTWDTPLDNLPPEIMRLILSLDERVRRLELELEEWRSSR